MAHVGFTSSDSDWDRILAFELWLQRNDADFFEWIRSARRAGTLREECFDLNTDPPKDFLSDSGLFDIVIAHNLWGNTTLCGHRTTGPTACSSLHSATAWRLRFQSSNARYVFLFGSDFTSSCLGGIIPGYDRIAVPSLFFLYVFTSSSDEPLSSQTPLVSMREIAEARLAHLPRLRMNESLDLSYTELGSAHCREIASMPRLRSLRLVGTTLTDTDLKYVGLPSLRDLFLDETAVADEGLRALEGCEQLECLSLNDTRVTGAGMRHLRPLQRLESLSLVQTAIDDEGVEHLKMMSSLRMLSLAGTRVSPGGLEELRNALPECAVQSSTG